MTLIARLLAPRILNLLAFTACVVAMAGALYLEHVEGLDPCPLCIFQRVGVITAGLFFLIALIHNPAATGQRIYAALAGIGAIGGAGVAGRHVWLQSLPPDQVPACGPALDYMLDVFPMSEVMRMVLTGSGECATIDWMFLGLSLPAWSLVVFLGLSAVALFQLFRRHA
jgi:protein dithiol:quinone oxidoreductase